MNLWEFRLDSSAINSQSVMQNRELICRHLISGCWLVKRKQRANSELICTFALTKFFGYLTRMKNRKNRDKTEEADNDPHGLSLNKENTKTVFVASGIGSRTRVGRLLQPQCCTNKRDMEDFKGDLPQPRITTDCKSLTANMLLMWRFIIRHDNKIKTTKSMSLLHEIPLPVVFKSDRKFLHSSRRLYSLTSDKAADLLCVSLVWRITEKFKQH